MNLLGKTITVGIFFASVAFMMLAVAVYATHKNWRDSAIALGTEVKQAEKDNIRLREELDKSKAKLATEMAARKQVIATLQTQYEQSQEQLSRLEATLASAQSQATTNAETLKTTAQTQANLTNEVGVLRNDVRAAQEVRDQAFDQTVALSEKLNETEGTVKSLTERHEQLQTQVSKQKKVLDSREINVDATLDDVPPRVDGVITQVGDKDLVELSVGSDDGLRQGHMLDVYRNNTYLGRVRVVKVDPDRAVAVILKDYRKGLIKKGDRVATKLT